MPKKAGEVISSIHQIFLHQISLVVWAESPWLVSMLLEPPSPVTGRVQVPALWRQRPAKGMGGALVAP